ncbi:N-acetylmuramoyl-L-alanine amidase [Paenibacillus sp. DS2015]|uniref:N-acetylmuramoyl-L-alanine amidase n=1 Tax=Paenibacillus sp. DS2015 TaxID=3373917 RepID=UPI003D1CB239
MKSIAVSICLCFSVLWSGCSSTAPEKALEDPLSSGGGITISDSPDIIRTEVEKGKSAPVVQTASIVVPNQNKESQKQELELKKPIICIEAGHQGKGNSSLEPNAPGSKIMKQKVMSGTQGIKTKKPEYQLTLEVALKLEKALNKDYKVIMVRRTNDVNISNSERAILCNKANADLMVRLHADGSDNHQIKGMSFLYPLLDSKYTKEIAPESLEAIKIISKYVIKETGAKSNGLKSRDDLTGFNWLKVPSILIEMGFMTNIEEDVLMSTSEYQDLIVRGIQKGLKAYYADL